MRERKHNLPAMFRRLDDQITRHVLDAIVIDPRSRGSSTYPASTAPKAGRPDAGSSSSAPVSDNASVYTEQHQLGGPEHYVVNYDGWNHRDSATSAQIVLTDDATAGQPDTPPPG